MVKKQLSNKINTVIADNIDDISVNDLSMFDYYYKYYNKKNFIETYFTELRKERINEILKDYNLKLFKLGNYDIDYMEVVHNV